MLYKLLLYPFRKEKRSVLEIKEVIFFLAIAALWGWTPCLISSPVPSTIIALLLEKQHLGRPLCQVPGPP